jgi:hypothetical protein
VKEELLAGAGTVSLVRGGNAQMFGGKEQDWEQWPAN